jgi:hypothetical protein
MRVLSFYRPAAPAGAPPSAEHMETMGRFAAEMTKKGHLVAAGGFLASSPMSVSLRGGGFTVGENAAAIVPEGFHGFGIIQAGSREELMSLVRRFLEIAGDGECRLHPLMDGPPQPQ